MCLCFPYRCRNNLYYNSEIYMSGKTTPTHPKLDEQSKVERLT